MAFTKLALPNTDRLPLFPLSFYLHLKSRKGKLTHLSLFSRASSSSLSTDANTALQNFLSSVQQPTASTSSELQSPSTTTTTPDANTALQNFLNSIKPGASGSQQQQQQADKPYTTLPDLLTPSSTLPYIHSLSSAQLDNLCAYLPADLFLLAQESEQTEIPSDPSPAAAQAAIEALSAEQKKQILERVLRSPQFGQSAGSLTVALRDGGLPAIGEGLGLRVRNGGK